MSMTLSGKQQIAFLLQRVTIHTTMNAKTDFIVLHIRRNGKNPICVSSQIRHSHVVGIFVTLMATNMPPMSKWF